MFRQESTASAYVARKHQCIDACLCISYVTMKIIQIFFYVKKKQEKCLQKKSASNKTGLTDTALLARTWYFCIAQPILDSCQRMATVLDQKHFVFANNRSSTSSICKVIQGIQWQEAAKTCRIDPLSSNESNELLNWRVSHINYQDS